MSKTTSAASESTKQVAYVAGLGRRLGAMLYDFLLLVAIWMFTLFILVIARGDEVTGWWVQLLLLAETTAFFLFCWRRGGQTLGMSAWRIKLLQTDGTPCTWKNLYLRLLCAPLSLACLGLGYLWLYVDPQKATWHDRISKTSVVHLPKS